MTMTTYQGSCACGRVRFDASFDLAAGTEKCNCTKCWKRRNWTARVRPEAFHLIAGADELVQPSAFADHSAPSGFCRGCGTTVFHRVAAAAWNDGAYVSVVVAVLDDLAPADLIAAPVRYLDGKHDNWWATPAETRHL